MRRVVLLIASIGILLLIGCSDTEETSVLEPAKDVSFKTAGAMKKPEPINTPASPQMPSIGTPTVAGVGYYRDWQLSEPLTDPVEPGTTIYTKIVFSEPMQHIASDEKDARPILSYVIEKTPVRYRIKPHKASGESFQSGDCKPRGDGTDDYICKYTVQNDDTGAFTLKIGKFSLDTDGNKLAATYTHATTLQLGEQQTPNVTEVNYYSDWELTHPFTERIIVGTTIYTKVVFSKPMAHVASDETEARPILSYVIGDREVRYRIKPHGASGNSFQSGDCKPQGDGTDDYICKYIVGASDAGAFTLKVDALSTDTHGNGLTNAYTHTTTLQLGIQQTLEPIEESMGLSREKIERLGWLHDPTSHVPLIKNVPKNLSTSTDLQIEVAEALRRGLTGNTSIERAIRVADRITRAFNRRLFAGTREDTLTIIEEVANEETGLDGRIFAYDLPRLFLEASGWKGSRAPKVEKVLFETRNPDLGIRPYRFQFFGDAFDTYTPREYYTRYWMTIEYLRLLFFYPDASEIGINILHLYRGSVFRGRVPVLWVNEWEPVVHIVPIIEVSADQSTFADIQIEVIEALKHGVTGDSPLERAIRINDRILWEINKRLYLNRHIYRQDAYTTYQDVFRSETGLDGKIITHDLPETYFLITTGSIAGVHIWPPSYTRYWMTMEYLRLRFTYPIAGPSRLLELFHESVRAGRVSEKSIRPR